MKPHLPLGAGVLLGLLASQHVIVVAAACFLIGLVVGRSWAMLGRLAEAALARLRPRELEAPAPYNRELDEICECGAHVRAVPCYFPPADQQRWAEQRAHPTFDPWSRRT